jgi:hypothetical protein
VHESFAARTGGFSRHHLSRFRDFYAAFPPEEIRATPLLKIADSKSSQTLSLKLPDEKTLLAELRQTRQAWELRRTVRFDKKSDSHE